MDLGKGICKERHERIGVGIAQNEQGRGIVRSCIHNGAGNVPAEEEGIFVLDRELVIIVERQRLFGPVCFVPGNGRILRRCDQRFHLVRQNPEKAGGGIKRSAKALGNGFLRERGLVDLRQFPERAQRIGGIVRSKRGPVMVGTVENIFVLMR